MLRRATLQITRLASDGSHLVGITPKLHENRGPSQNLGGVLKVNYINPFFKETIQKP